MAEHKAADSPLHTIQSRSARVEVDALNTVERVLSVNLPMCKLHEIVGYRIAKKPDPRMRLALALLQENLSSPDVHIRQIATNLHMSSSHLRHIFKKAIGVSPSHFVKNLRLQQAHELLRTTLLSVKEIMAIVGFNDPSHFVRDYKVRYGERPSQTRAAGLEQSVPSSGRARNVRQ